MADRDETPNEGSPTQPLKEKSASDADGQRRLSSLVLVLLAALAVGVLAMGVYAIQVSTGEWSVFASALMIAGASAAAGGLIGLLFGVPRTVARDTPPPPALGQTVSTPTPLAGIGANTNLEQISDWLTKIIVGVGLVQLGTIKSGAAKLFGNLAPALGGGDAGAAFAGAIVIYFSVFGFFSGWLFARLRLGVAMSNADALISLAKRAEQAGDKATAEAVRGALASSVGGLAGGTGGPSGEEALKALATEYEQLRATAPSGPSRTAQMDDLASRARELAATASFTQEDVHRTFESGTEGRRVMALALMQGDASLADFDIVLNAVTDSRSAFEQYVALGVANLMVASLNPAQRTHLSEALESDSVRQKMAEDASRSRIASRILDRLRQT